RLEIHQLGVLVVGVGDDDDLVAGVHEPGSGTVETAVARAGRAGDGVGLEAVAIVDIDHRHLLVLEDVGLCHQPWVDGDRTDVVEVGVGDGGPVDLGLHHAASHQTVTPRLSMSRARPSRAAMSRRSSPLSTAGTVRSLASTTAA